MAAAAKPDGYTISQLTISAFRLPHMQKVDWDPLRDYTYIIGVSGYAFGVVVRSDSPFKTFNDLLGYAKAHPGELGPEVVAHGPPHHPTGEAVNGHRQVQEPRPGRDVGDVGHPLAVGLGGAEVPLQQIRGRSRGGVSPGGPEPLAPVHSLQATGPHQPGHPLLPAPNPMS